MENTINSSSSNLASFVGFDSAQKAWGHYKQSEYTACCAEIASTIGKLSCVFSLGVFVCITAYNASENTLGVKASNLLSEKDIQRINPFETSELSFSSLLRNFCEAFTLISSLNPVSKNIASATLAKAVKKPAVHFSEAAMVRYYIKGADSYNLYRSRRVAETVDWLFGKYGSKMLAKLVKELVGEHRFIALKRPSELFSRNLV